MKTQYDIRNTQYEHAQRVKRLYRFIAKGVTIIDPLTTYIADNVKIDRGTVIYPLTVIESDVRIGKGCSIGPFCRIRPGTRLKDRVAIGNFVEVVRSNIGTGSKAKHLTYIGDTTIEEKVNVGAGTIVANYDGKLKYKTKIRQGAFIGSGSILVAPVKIGKRAITGAGAVVTKNHDVPDNTVVIGVPAKILIKRDCPRQTQYAQRTTQYAIRNTRKRTMKMSELKKQTVSGIKGRRLGRL